MMYDDLVERFYLQCDLDNLAWIAQTKKEIQSLEPLYHKAIQDKDFKRADIIKEAIELCKQDIRTTENELIAANGRGQVPQTQPGRGKTIFILKK